MLIFGNFRIRIDENAQNQRTILCLISNQLHNQEKTKEKTKI